MALIMGTAGHIDHGKTSLIKALTGTDCDRLNEEKRRGITIELGFTFLDCPKNTDDKNIYDSPNASFNTDSKANPNASLDVSHNESLDRIGIIDVPGHERFVRTMVAGATGIDFVLMVIAANEGIMPQTQEHLEICKLLGIQHGLIALTKSDMLSPEEIQNVSNTIRLFMSESFLEKAPIFPVSSLTGQGINELKSYICQYKEKIQTKSNKNILRLPIDRIFSLKGHGTVITGTLISGSANINEEICIYPKGQKARIRSMQRHGKNEESAKPGQRISMGISSISIDELSRGDIIAKPDTLFPSKSWIVKLTCLANAPHSLRHRTEVHFHHGTKEILARLYFYDRDQLLAGESTLCEVRFPEPMCGIFMDTAVIRSFSPLCTVAGALILNPLGNTPRRKDMDIQRRNTLLSLSELDAQNLVYEQIHFAQAFGIKYDKIRVLTNIENLDTILEELIDAQRIFLFDTKKRHYISLSNKNVLEKQFLETLEKYHEKNPKKIGLLKKILLILNKEILSEYILQGVLAKKLIKQVGDNIALITHHVEENDATSILKNTILKAIDIPLPPSFKELTTTCKLSEKDLRPLLQTLVQEQKIVKINEDIYFSRKYVDFVVQRLLVYFEKNSILTPSDFKDISQGLTRKYSIPLLEHFDKVRFTLRTPDGRTLRDRNVFN